MKLAMRLIGFSTVLAALMAAIFGQSGAFGVAELQWIPDGAKLVMAFDRPPANDALFARVRDEILSATHAGDTFHDFLRLVSRDPDRLVIAAVPTPGEDEIIGIARDSFDGDLLPGLARAGKLSLHEQNRRSFYIAAPEGARENDFAITPLDANHLAFGGVSAIRRILDIDRGALQVVALPGLLPEVAPGAEAWGLFLPGWFGFRHDESQLLRCDVRGRSVSRSLANLGPALFSVRVSADAEFRMRTQARDADDALILADALRAFLAGQRVGNKNAPAEVRKVLEEARVATDGAAIRLSLRLTLQAMERIRNNQASTRILRWQLDSQERELRSNIGEIFDLMQINEGDHVADIGPGLGFFTVRLARAVGARGRVLAVDIDPEALGELEKRLREAPFPQAQVVRGEPDDPKLPPGALDAALIFNSYHEMSEYQKMLERILRALKPGGRLVLVEPFSEARRKDPRESQVREHVIAPELAEAELRRTGFEIVARNDEFNEHRDSGTSEWLILARRPGSVPIHPVAIGARLAVAQ